eukprot:PITA_21952
MDTIQSAWDIPINGSPSFVWEQKLKATKKALKEWLRKLHNPSTQQRKADVQQLETLQIAENHFKDLYDIRHEDNKEDTEDLLSHIPHLITHEDNQVLLKPLSEEEIIKVIWAMESDKALGPDGFTIHFYKVCWNIIKTYLLKMIQGFFGKTKVGGGINSTFLALIPKEANLETFGRFRPISLCNASYKILSKIIANRIKPLLDKLISNAQGGFIKGRHILDNIIQVQEAIHSSKQRKEKGMLIKLDMANAFDRVNHSFLFQVLRSFGFPPQFINLIKACITNPWISPMVNGRPTSFFQAHRGLRQVCPLSPFLYILMADSLSRKLTAEMNSGDLPGAVINDRKSSIFGWNLSQHNLTIIAQTLGFECFTHWDNIKYLGLPLTSGVNNRSLWHGIINKIKDKITSWGGYWLTKGGKIILLKSVLSALPIYQAPFLLAPKHIMDQISCLLRDFLWKGGRGNHNKIHLANWDLVKRPILDGGLQIREPSLSNLSLGCKLLWKIYSEPSHPVSEMLISKYAQGISLRYLSANNTTTSTHTWNLCRKSINNFRKHLYRISGNGEKTLLWKDRIMNNPPLNSYEEIRDLRDWLHEAGIRKLNEISAWDSKGNWIDWAIPPMPVQCQYQIAILKTLVSNAAPVHRNSADRWGWGDTGFYTSALGYSALQIKKDRLRTPSLWKQVWSVKGLPIFNFFFWILMQNKQLTGDNLSKRNFVGPHRCVMCRNSGETTSHLFIDCVYAKEVWKLSLLGLPASPPHHSSMADLFSDWFQYYPQIIPNKSLWYHIWLSIPKFAWLNLHSPHPISKARSLPPPLPAPSWKIREPEDAFQSWWKIQKTTSIFFDGASKGNPGVAGAGGVIYFSNNPRKVQFCWGLGIRTNNQAELLALTKACQIVRDKGIKECQAFRDSKILIKNINSDDQFNDAILNKSLKRLKLILQDFTSFKIYHILRSLNREADEMANKGCLLTPGTLNNNGNNANSHCIP